MITTISGVFVVVPIQSTDTDWELRTANTATNPPITALATVRDRRVAGGFGAGVWSTAMPDAHYPGAQAKRKVTAVTA